MFRELRRIKQMLDDEQTESILRDCEYGVLSTCSQDGQPYGVPLNFVYENGRLYFHCATQGQKLDYIALNPKVCFTVTAKAEILAQDFSTSYQSVVAMGTAGVVEGEEKKQALTQLIRKYSPDYLQEGLAYIDRAIDRTTVVRIDIENLCGKHGH